MLRQEASRCPHRYRRSEGENSSWPCWTEEVWAVGPHRVESPGQLEMGTESSPGGSGNKLSKPQKYTLRAQAKLDPSEALKLHFWKEDTLVFSWPVWVWYLPTNTSLISLYKICHFFLTGLKMYSLLPLRPAKNMRLLYILWWVYHPTS